MLITFTQVYPVMHRFDRLPDHEPYQLTLLDQQATRCRIGNIFDDDFFSFGAPVGELALASITMACAVGKYAF